jgi:Rrf2 family iron-sulfur cluster assembly transcriptional regulator
MRLGTKGRYAVMAVVDLARHSGGAPVTLSEIAERQDISLPYLEQLFAKLRRAGIVRSVRGPGGGYLLGRDIDQLPIAEIVAASDEPIRATRCGSDAERGCRPDLGRCITHDLWEALGNQIQAFLASVTVGDVLHRRIRPAAMLHVPMTRKPELAEDLRSAAE